MAGDIATARCEAIVNAWNRNFIPHWLLLPQGVSRALRKAAGPAPFREVGRQGLLGLGEVAVTSAGRLDATYILHAAALHAWWRASRCSVERAVDNVFRRAAELGVSTIALPLLGAGTGGLAPSESFDITKQAWQRAEAKPSGTYIYVFDAATYERLVQR